MNSGLQNNQKLIRNHETAQSLMVGGVPTIVKSATVADVERLLITKAKEFESVNYIYVLDRSGVLAGVVSIKEIFQAPKSVPIDSLATKSIVSVRPRTDQERVAQIAIQNKLKAIPVVDSSGIFLGAVTSDTILDVAYREFVEDIFRLGGITHRGGSVLDDIFKLSIFTSLKHRLPWLLVGLFGGFFVADIIGKFELILSRHLILAAFIPLVVYVADAVRGQMQAFMIRDLAVNQKLSFVRYFFRQLSITMIIAVVVGLVAYFVGAYLYNEQLVGVVLALSLFVASVSSVVTGLAIPFLVSRLGFDPANASGPLATVIQDAASITIYFLIASFLL